MTDTYWRRWGKASILSHLEKLKEFYGERICPAFANLEAQANRKAQEVWNQRMAQPPGVEPEDHAHIAEDAEEDALEWYLDTQALQYDLNGVFCVALYRWVERFLKRFLQRALLPPGHNAKTDGWGWGKICKEYAEVGISLKRVRAFEEVDLLRLGHNVYKHGRGRSLDELRARMPRWFEMGLGPDEPRVVVDRLQLPNAFVLQAFAAAQRFIEAVMDEWGES